MTLVLVLAQATFLLGLYIFLFWIGRVMLAELRQPEPQRATPMAPGTGQLVVLQGDGPRRGETFVLTSRAIGIGRDPLSELVVADRFASAQHARIITMNGGYWIEDLGSQNGTMVNGKKIAMVTPLTPGDRVEVGDTVFRFEATEGRA